VCPRAIGAIWFEIALRVVIAKTTPPNLRILAMPVCILGIPGRHLALTVRIANAVIAVAICCATKAIALCNTIDAVIALAKPITVAVTSTNARC
jgi:hypothetical protein